MQERKQIESFLLCNMKGIGAASIRRLLQETEDVEEILNLPDEKLKLLLGEKRADCFRAGVEDKQRKAAERRYYQMKEKGIFFLPCWDENYPVRLKQLVDAPVCLYGRGRLPEDGKKAVAIVGARECSGYGSVTAKYFAAGLAKKGAVIVSGMARGVDGMAQWAALDAGGISTGVLGCGVDICYPPENWRLYERLVKEGCLLSEYPPGTEPRASLFPPRNRIISGLSDMVLVTEAREKSGTLITVDMALEQGRDVFAVPGRITDSLSCGCNRLIENGAGIAVSAAQLWQELQGMHGPEKHACQPSGTEKTCAGQLSVKTCTGQPPEETGKAPPDGIKEVGPGRECCRVLGRRILKILDSDPVSLDEIQRRLTADGCSADVSVPELMEELVLLCMEGKAGKRAGMYFAVV